MSQVQLNNSTPKVQSDTLEQAQWGPQQNAQLPEYLQNARISTSILAKSGKVVGGAFDSCGAIAKLGKNEITTLCDQVKAFDTAPKPRVESYGNLLPFAQPQADCANSQLYKSLVNLNLPQAYKDALIELLQELSLPFVQYAPKDISGLAKWKIVTYADNQPFVFSMSSSVRKCPEELTPASFKELAKQILLPDLTRKSMLEALKQEADNLGLKISHDGLQAAACELFDKGGQELFKNQGQASEFVAGHKELAKSALQKASLLEGLNKK